MRFPRNSKTLYFTQVKACRILNICKSDNLINLESSSNVIAIAY